MELVPLVNEKTKTRVSSVLNKDVKNYGRKFMLDNKEDTCWNSDQGSPQWIYIEFDSSVRIERMEIQFQGGFVGKDCRLNMVSSENGEVAKCNFYPEDINQLQIFPIQSNIASKTVKIHFLNSTDFFGRIIIYQLQLYGKKIDGT